MTMHDWVLMLEAIRDHKEVAIPAQLHLRGQINGIVNSLGGEAEALEYFMKVEAAQCTDISEVNNG
jgi:hypothetical protein